MGPPDLMLDVSVRSRLARSRLAAVVATLLVAVTGLVVAPGGAAGVATHGWPAGSLALGEPSAPVVPSVSLTALLTAPRETLAVPSAYAPVANSTLKGYPAGVTLPVLVTLSVQNASGLSSVLAALENSSSPTFERYLTAAQFTRDFAPNASAYASLVEYVASFGVGNLTAFPGRLALAFSASPEALGELLGTTVGRYSVDGTAYWASAGEPSLPAPLVTEVAEISGLGPSSLPVARPLAAVGEGTAASSGSALHVAAGTTSLAPVTNGSVQYLYPSDLQTAYDEESLFAQYGYPRGTDLAALLWSGIYDGNTSVSACGTTLTPGTAVGAYDPSDPSSFFANATPSGEPEPALVSVNPLGSPGPNCTASWDTTGVVAANTAELESMGELAPGSTVYAVSAPGPSLVELLDAFAVVLSPPTSLSPSVRAGLSNVSVLEVGWATKDTRNASWATDLEEAAARGLTVVAATGNSGDNEHSVAWDGTDAQFPASAGGANYGSLAVGGLTVTLDAANDHLASEVVWNVSASYAAEGGPAGSASGISKQFGEPGYQQNSSANKVIAGNGRGVPDVSAAANNTLVTVTVDGEQYWATNATTKGPYRFAYGTGVAAAIVTGLLGEVDHTLAAANNSWLGFANTAIYSVANEEYLPAPSGGQVTSKLTGSYDSELPTVPFYDVTAGGNDAYKAGVGYDLATGWGSIDAYNFTMYVLQASTAGTYGDLVGVRDRVTLSDLVVTSKLPDGSVDRTYNASLQQDLVLANSLGAPVYSVESVVYLSEVAPGAWAMNFTANLTYPFEPLNPGLTIHEVWFPPAGNVEDLPRTPTLTTTLEAATATTPPELLFEYGLPVAPDLTLPAPGAAYIIGRTGYSYSWQGATYTDGPKDNGSAAGFLAPQFLLVGAPPDATGSFGSGTSGNVTASVEPAGSTTFAPAATGLVTSVNSQSPSSSSSLFFLLASASNYEFYFSPGTDDQGFFEAEAPYFPVVFNQSGAPDGATWFVNLSSGVDLSGVGSTTSVSANLQNGSYGWVAAIDVKNWSATPSSGSFTVAGKATHVTLVFGPGVSTITFKAKGPEKSGQLDFTWYANITGGPSLSGTALTFTTNVSFGTYAYTIACANKNYIATKTSGSIDAGPAAITIPVTFVVRTYGVQFIFHFPKPAPSLTVTIGSISETDTDGEYGSLTFPEALGNYSWSIGGLPFGWGAIPSHGVVSVNGPVSPIVIKVSTTGWGPFGLGVVGYVLIGVVIGVAAVWGVVYFWRRRVRRRKGAQRPDGPAPPPAETPPAKTSVGPANPPSRPRASRNVARDDL